MPRGGPQRSPAQRRRFPPLAASTAPPAQEARPRPEDGLLNWNHADSPSTGESEGVHQQPSSPGGVYD